MSTAPVMYDLGKDAVHASGLVARPDAPAPRDRSQVVVSANGSDARGGGRQSPQDMVARSLEIMARKLAPLTSRVQQENSSRTENPPAAARKPAPVATQAPVRATPPESARPAENIKPAGNTKSPGSSGPAEITKPAESAVSSAASRSRPQPSPAPRGVTEARVDASRSVPVRHSAPNRSEQDSGAIPDAAQARRNQAGDTRPRGEAPSHSVESDRRMAELMEQAAEQKSAMPGPAVVVGLPLELMRYDMNGDGRIDSLEMEHVRRAKDENSGFRSLTAAVVGQSRRFSEDMEASVPAPPPPEPGRWADAVQEPGRWVEEDQSGRWADAIEEPGRWVEENQDGRWADAIEEPGRWVEENQDGRWADAIEEPGRWVEEEEATAEDAIPPKLYGEEAEKQVSHYRRLIEEETRRSLSLSA